MQYILLIYTSETEMKDMPAADRGRMFQEYGAFTESVKKSNQYQGGAPLESTSMATTVRVRNGKTLRTDGPFAETREKLGGYYLIDAPNLDEAVNLAARIPGARHGSIEVRPVMQLPM
jgi:hypothetical protein